MKRITEHPEFTVDVESFELFDSSESEIEECILRIVYRRSDDGRRTTSFYDGNKESLEVLYQILVQSYPAKQK